VAGSAQNIPPMGKVSTQHIFHFDPKGRNYSKMNQVMMFVECHGKMKRVFVNKWNGGTVITLWNAVWEDSCPFMSTQTVMSAEDGKTGATVMNMGDGDTGTAAAVIAAGTADTADAADVSFSMQRSCIGKLYTTRWKEGGYSITIKLVRSKGNR
jgi:hypothetical protein